MPVFAVLLEDDPEHAAAIRSRHMPAHLDFLDRHAGVVNAAGPLFDNALEQPAGGLWLVTADNAAAVTVLTREDPFWTAGLRRAVRILEWKQVFADGERKR